MFALPGISSSGAWLLSRSSIEGGVFPISCPVHSISVREGIQVGVYPLHIPSLYLVIFCLLRLSRAPHFSRFPLPHQPVSLHLRAVRLRCHLNLRKKHALFQKYPLRENVADANCCSLVLLWVSG